MPILTAILLALASAACAQAPDNPVIFESSFESGTKVGWFDNGALVMSGDAAVRGENWSASFSQTPLSGSVDGGAGFDWPDVYGTRNDREAWVQFAVKWGDYASTIQKVFRFKNGKESQNAGSIITSGGQFCWSWDFYATPNSTGPCFAALFSPGQWHWFDIHYEVQSGQRATVAIYLDGKRSPVLTSIAGASTNDAISEYQFFGTVNNSDTWRLANTVTWKWDAVRISTNRLPLPAGAKVGTP